MHVGLNLIFLEPGETGGMEIVARKLIPALVEVRKDIRLTAFVSRDAAGAADAPWGELVPAVTVPVRARSRADRVRGEQQLLPLLARRAGVDIVHSLASTGPAWGRFRRVVTVHDLIYRFYPEAHTPVRALAMRVLVPLAAHTAHRVTADSESTREDLVRYLRVRRDKIDVVPLGVSAPTVTPTPGEELRRRLDLGEGRLLLAVGAKRPHKNLMRLLDALARIPAERRPLLVLPGYTMEGHDRELEQHASQLGVSAHVRIPGWVSESDLEGLYDLASVAVVPSLYEGFGLAVLEAMARGTPVACSNRSSVPEVAGDAALLFDPENPVEIADAVERLLGNEREAERLSRAGRKRAEAFTWEQTARMMAATYERALASRRRKSASSGESSTTNS